MGEGEGFKKKIKHPEATPTIQWPLVLYSSFMSGSNKYKGTGDLGVMAAPFAPAGRPTTTQEAAANGWKPLQKECVPNLGYPWAFDGIITDGAPITLYYSKETKQNDGLLTGMAVHYYDNGAPETMIGSVFSKGDDYDTLQVAFHDKDTAVCGGGSLDKPSFAVLLVDGKGRKDFPMTEDAAKASGEWSKGSCLGGMGVHYWNDMKHGSNLSFEAKNLYPMAPMYNQKDGSLNGIMFIAPKLMHTWDTEICDINPFLASQECLTTTNFWDVGPGQLQKRADTSPLFMCQNFCGDSCSKLLTGATGSPPVYDTMHWFFVEGGEATACGPRC